MNILELLKNEKVEWKKLGDIGKFYGGITGKTKQDFNDGNVKFITYKNIYLNPATDLNVEDKVKIKPEENQRKLMYGDILFTGSSETLDECGISSVITTKLTEDIYLNSFCFFLRLNDSDLLLPDFSKHLFRSETLRIKIGETASGVTRFNVSKDLMKKIEIPIPSIETQKKIVKILDKFTEYVTELQAELQAELQDRTLQYNYYRDKLLSEEYLDRATRENCGEIEIVELGELCEILDNKRIPISKDKREKGIYPYYGCNGIQDWVKEYIFDGTYLLIGEDGSVLNSDNTPVLHYVSDKKFWVNNHAHVLDCNRQRAYLKYIYYFLSQTDISGLVKGVPPKLNQANLKTIKIILPKLDVQKEIIRILDKFQDILKDTEGLLPTEIEQRQKQYEYYREKLLTFGIESGTASQPARNFTRYYEILEEAANIVGIKLKGTFEFKKIEEIFEMKNGYTPSKQNKEFWTNGTIPWFRMDDLRLNGRILKDSIQHVTASAVKGDLFEANSIIMATTATIGEHALLIADSLANQQFTNFTIRKSLKEKINIKYIYYYFFKIDEWAKKHTRISSFPSVDMDELKKVIVTVPDIETQKKIVEILENFEKITTSIQEGLPKEIELRQKQYEYYREKLLSFNR